MSADDHLSGSQFYPMHKLLGMASPNYDEDDLSVVDDGTTVQDRFPVVKQDIRRSPGYYGALKTRMQEHGQTRPLVVDTAEFDDGRPSLGNGHHRIYLAHQLGWKGMHAVHDPEDREIDTDPEFDTRTKRDYRRPAQ
jgi:hypothetical protein